MPSIIERINLLERLTISVGKNKKLKYKIDKINKRTLSTKSVLSKHLVNYGNLLSLLKEINDIHKGTLKIMKDMAKEIENLKRKDKVPQIVN